MSTSHCKSMRCLGGYTSAEILKRFRITRLSKDLSHFEAFSWLTSLPESSSAMPAWSSPRCRHAELDAIRSEPQRGYHAPGAMVQLGLRLNLWRRIGPL